MTVATICRSVVGLGGGLLGYCALTTYLTPFLADRFGMTDTDDQLRFNAIANGIGVATLVLFSLVGGVLSDRVGRRKPFIVAGGLVMAVALVGVAAAPSGSVHESADLGGSGR